MRLLLPASVSEARECLARGAVPIGGATLVWAAWQQDGFPELAVSLRHVPEANVVSPESLGSAVILGQIDDRVPGVLRRAAGTVGTGAVRRTATVGGNIVGSSLRCLLPAALALDARATVLEPDGVFRTDLAEVVAKRKVLLSLEWRKPVADGYRKLPAEAGGPPPFVVAVAVHAGEDGHGRRLRVAVRDGYEVHCADVPCGTDAERVLAAVETQVADGLAPAAREAVREQVTEVQARSGRS
ncbi:FAD binding domain-containing protein [Streptomyces abyssomicinicus]|uniref:FAD binding domain-containing protein n=1 Tax=Streptomyces abyssomicinicus TaxID=574929 RepID=UPI0012505870|nr:FAD binding domain-containing protein [Streptomyces abyssomicinicus]